MPYDVCIDFRRKVAAYSESNFRAKQFIADASFPLARHIVGPENSHSLTVPGWTDDKTMQQYNQCNNVSCPYSE